MSNRAFNQSSRKLQNSQAFDRHLLTLKQNKVKNYNYIDIDLVGFNDDGTPYELIHGAKVALTLKPRPNIEKRGW